MSPQPYFILGANLKSEVHPNIVHVICWCQGHQNVITSFPRPNNVFLAVWLKSMHWFTTKTANKAHFYSLNSLVSLKIRSSSPKSNHFFPMSQWC